MFKAELDILGDDRDMFPQPPLHAKKKSYISGNKGVSKLVSHRFAISVTERDVLECIISLS